MPLLSHNTGKQLQRVRGDRETLDDRKEGYSYTKEKMLADKRGTKCAA